MKTQVSQIPQNRVANGVQKTGSFYDRVVELGSPRNIGIAIVAIGAYMLNIPIWLIAFEIGGAFVCKKLYYYNTDIEERKLAILEKIVRDFDNRPRENQAAIIQKISSMIDADKLNDPKKFQAFIKGCVAFFEKIANDNAEKTKSDALAGVLYLLEKYLVEKKAADIGTNKETIDLVRLGQSLDSLIIENSKSLIIEPISKIKQALPLSTAEQLALNFKNMESKSAATRLAALYELVKAYETSAEKQVDILKAIIKMLTDNIGFSQNGYGAFREIQRLIIKGKINDATKFQAIVDGFADYLKNPGDIDYTSFTQDNGNLRILFLMIKTMLPQFIGKYKTEFIKEKIDLTRLKQSLEDLAKNIPDDYIDKSLKQNISSVLMLLRPLIK